MIESSEAALLRDVLDELQAINDRLGAMLAQSQSSVQIATSARGHDVTVKVYAGSPVTEAGTTALAEYRRLTYETQQAQMNAWAETLKAVTA